MFSYCFSGGTSLEFVLFDLSVGNLDFDVEDTTWLTAGFRRNFT